MNRARFSRSATLALRVLSRSAMRAVVALFVLPAAALVVACSSESSPSEDEPTDEGALSTTGFKVTPGVERVKQHKGPVDVIENPRHAFDLPNAYWMARLSQIAYRDLAELKRQLEEIGLKTDADHFRFFE